MMRKEKTVALTFIESGTLTQVCLLWAILAKFLFLPSSLYKIRGENKEEKIRFKQIDKPLSLLI